MGRGSSLTERSSDRNISRDLRMQTAYSLVTGKNRKTREQLKEKNVHRYRREKLIISFSSFDCVE